MEDRKYLTTWKRYLPVIRLHIKKSLVEEQQFKLNITDFESAGDRGKSGYTFNITMENGKVINNISGSAVARDLFEALKSDELIKAMQHIFLSISRLCFLLYYNKKSST